MTRQAFIHDLNVVIEAVCRRVLSHADGAVRRRLPVLITGAGQAGQDGDNMPKTQNSPVFFSSKSLRHTLPNTHRRRHQTATHTSPNGQKTPDFNCPCIAIFTHTATHPPPPTSQPRTIGTVQRKARVQLDRHRNACRMVRSRPPTASCDCSLLLALMLFHARIAAFSHQFRLLLSFSSSFSQSHVPILHL